MRQESTLLPSKVMGDNCGWRKRNETPHRPLALVLRCLGTMRAHHHVIPALLLVAACSEQPPQFEAACNSAQLVEYLVASSELRQSYGAACLPRPLAADDEGRVSCLIIEGRRAEETCDCSAAGRHPVAPEHEPAVDLLLDQSKSPGTDLNCFCEVTQLAGAALAACQHDLAEEPQYQGQDLSGWCYVDATTVPPVGDPKLVSHCPRSEQRDLRFLGGVPLPGARLVIVCETLSCA